LVFGCKQQLVSVAKSAAMLNLYKAKPLKALEYSTDSTIRANTLFGESFLGGPRSLPTLVEIVRQDHQHQLVSHAYFLTLSAVRYFLCGS
jgi:hypothetical protein